MVVKCRGFMTLSRQFLWTLSVRTVKTDLLSPARRQSCHGGVFKHTMNPNHREVVKKHHVYDTRLAQYLLEI